MSNYEYGVKWESLGEMFPEEIHPKPSREIAERAVADSVFPGAVIRRTVTEWEEV